MMSHHPIKVIVLAAGKGTRMKSDLPKVLHSLGNRPMIEYVLDTAEALSPVDITLVINLEMSTFVEKLEPRTSLKIAIQEKQLGTGDAVLAARKSFEDFQGTILILFGDTPLIKSHTLARLLKVFEDHSQAAVAILGMYPEEKAGYSRIQLKENGTVSRIIEQKDASEEELKNDFCNSGVLALRGKNALDILTKIKPNNKAGEYYLTDAVPIANSMSFDVHVIEGDAFELMGINSQIHLANAEAMVQNQWRRSFLERGVTLIDPHSVYFSYDTEIASECVVEPYVVFGLGVRVGKGVTIKSFSYLSGTVLMEKSAVGPFAHLRPGTTLHSHVRVGNFVEVKNSVLKENVKANHLSYIGDSEIGAESNIGAGTITCNYDGFSKNRTILGKNVFIGSNTSLVAPITVGDGAIVGAGSVITKDVESGSLAIGRGDQRNIKDGGTRYREKQKKRRQMQSA